MPESKSVGVGDQPDCVTAVISARGEGGRTLAKPSLAVVEREEPFPSIRELLAMPPKSRTRAENARVSKYFARRIAAALALAQAAPRVEKELEKECRRHGYSLAEVLRASREGRDPVPDLKPKPKTNVVYFVRATGLDLIKIGTTDTLTKRVDALRAASPAPLELLKHIAGDVRRETTIHRQFKHLRSHGEWFRATDELVAFIAEVS